MVLLGDNAQVEARFDLFADSGNLDARMVPGSRQTYHRLRNHLGHNRWYYLVTWVMWNLVSVYLETVLVLVQDRCMVCATCTIGLEILLDAIDCTRR
jgi:cytochrome b